MSSTTAKDAAALKPDASAPFLETVPVQRRWRPTWQLIVCVVLGILGLFVPQVVSDSHLLETIGQGLVLGVASTGVGLLVRQTGLVNFGAGALYGGGAYLFAIAATRLGLPLLPAAGIAIVGSVVLSLIVGMLTVRSGHLAFAILTIAFSQLLLQLVGTQLARPATGGADGIVVTETGSFFGFDGRALFASGSFWVLAWIAAMLALVIAYVVEKSRLGRIARAIQANEERMRFAGYGTFWPKVTIFVIAGFLGGLSGMLTGMHFAFVSPDLLNLNSGGDILVATFIGGAFSPIGPLLGAVLFSIAQDQFSAGGQLDLFTGIGIVVAVVVMRRGIVGVIEAAVQLIRRRVISRSRSTSESSQGTESGDTNADR